MVIFSTQLRGQQLNGSILAPAEMPHLRQLDVSESSDGTLKLKGPLPSFVKVWPMGEPKRQLEFSFNASATEITLNFGKQRPEKLMFLLAEETAAYADGVVVLSALDAKVVGSQAKLETHPGSHRIGYWSQASDYVVWDADIPADNYQAELVYSRATRTGTQATIVIGKKEFPLTLEKTGSWYRYRVIQLGKVAIVGKGKTHVEVRVNKIVNGGVMNLKAIVLTPKGKKKV